MMGRMTCEKVRSLLSAYLDKELAYHKLRQVELHLLDCEACQRECRALRRTKDLLGMLEEPELPREFWPELRERMSLHPKRRLYPGFLLKALAPVAALLLLAILPFTLDSHIGASKDTAVADTDLVEPYIREYVISGFDRPFSDKTSLGFVATDHAVSMYSSDLFSSYEMSAADERVITSNPNGRRIQEVFRRVTFLSSR